jgi:hypothetical protein
MAENASSRTVTPAAAVVFSGKTNSTKDSSPTVNGQAAALTWGPRP